MWAYGGIKTRKNTRFWVFFWYGADEGTPHTTIYCVYGMLLNTIFCVFFILLKSRLFLAQKNAYFFTK